MIDAMVAVGLAGAAAANSAIPGPCLLIVSSRAATRGFGSGLRVTLGVAASDAVLLLAAWSLISGATTLSDDAAAILRVGGLFVMATIGVVMLCPRPKMEGVSPTFDQAMLGDVALGAALGLSSPLNLLFMFALLPQFVDIGDLKLTCVALASGAIILGGALPFLVLSLAACRVDARDPRAALRVTRVCGAAILALSAIALLNAP